MPASMGPHSFKCGSPSEKAAGKEERNASMGPHSFKCGSGARQASVFCEDLLQWGRTLSSAEV